MSVDNKMPALDLIFGECFFGFIGHGALDGNVGIKLKAVDLAHAVSGDSRIFGQSTQDISRPKLGLSPTVDREGHRE